MKLLLDTHAFIWFDSSPSELGPAAVAACRDPGNELILSVASVWEIQIKLRLGKLKLHRPLRELLDDQV
jgi:PIN domain nuclease of toxin-antitoxin system